MASISCPRIDVKKSFGPERDFTRVSTNITWDRTASTWLLIKQSKQKSPVVETPQQPSTKYKK
eukprot:scaffold4200_cov164-Amphora_coffeaeformis.AAC.3